MNKWECLVTKILIVILVGLFWRGCVLTYREMAEKDERIGSLTAVIDSLTANPNYPLKWLGICAVSKYTASRDETDDTPTLTAYMYNLTANDYNKVGACNFLPYGTEVFIDSIGWITIVDKMHRRYQTNIDVFCKNKKDAKEWGIKIVNVWSLK